MTTLWRVKRGQFEVTWLLTTAFLRVAMHAVARVELLRQQAQAVVARDVLFFPIARCAG